MAVNHQHTTHTYIDSGATVKNGCECRAVWGGGGVCVGEKGGGAGPAPPR